METLRESLLHYEIQREIEKARQLEKRGEHKKSTEHYLRAAAIYRKLAYNVPVDKAKGMFHTASQYENLVRGIRNREKVESFRELSPSIQEELIDSLIVTQKPATDWDEIGGLKDVKQTIREAIILPFIRDKPPFVKSFRTILLYGPPGTGKTMLAKASSNTLEATFFEARTSSLLSKYFGESSKIVRTLFGKAKKMQPSLIFMDEIDSLTIRRDSDISESMRRVLGELLMEIDGFNTGREERILIMAATNKPWDLDDAILSRFQKKIYVPLPDSGARKAIFRVHLEQAKLSGIKTDELAQMSEGFSGRDIQAVCQEAISKMVREQNPELERLTARDVEKYSLKHRPLERKDFDSAFAKVKPAIKGVDVKKYEKWGQEIGELPASEEEKAEPELHILESELKDIQSAKEETEKKFYNREIDETTFQKLMQDYEEKIISLNVKIKGLKEKLGA